MDSGHGLLQLIGNMFVKLPLHPKRKFDHPKDTSNSPPYLDKGASVFWSHPALNWWSRQIQIQQIQHSWKENVFTLLKTFLHSSVCLFGLWFQVYPPNTAPVLSLATTTAPRHSNPFKLSRSFSSHCSTFQLTKHNKTQPNTA